MSSAVTSKPLSPRRYFGTLVVIALFALLAASGWWWLPLLRERLALVNEKGNSEAEAAKHDHHAGHGHDHPGHVEENSLELSRQARGSIGLREGVVSLSNFRRTIGVPGIVVERRGRSRIDIIAPLTGFITKIYPTEGEAMTAGQPLFELRLTHEELVQAQADLLKTTEELDVVLREINRLESVGQGVIPAKSVLDRKYEQQKLEGIQRAQRQALLLHGLSESQVNDIIHNRTLLSSIVVYVPDKMGVTPATDDEVILQVQELKVERGQHVTAGDSMAVLADHRVLLIEGEAFEQDVPQITQTVASNLPVTAILEAKAGQPAQIEGLQITYVANRIDPTSRALHFYVTLPNRTVRDSRGAGGERFVEWQFKPGQRMQLRVPVEEWTDRIVLPTDAVAQDGVENYVFRANGDHFDRQAVRVEHRDPLWIVVANDGSLFPGEQIALSAAQQLQLALKNKSGGAIDPHAGHNH